METEKSRRRPAISTNDNMDNKRTLQPALVTELELRGLQTLALRAARKGFNLGHAVRIKIKNPEEDKENKAENPEEDIKKKTENPEEGIEKNAKNPGISDV